MCKVCCFAVQVADVTEMCETLVMANQQPNPSPSPRHREDYKVQRLLERIQRKLSPQAQTIREADRTLAKQ